MTSGTDKSPAENDADTSAADTDAGGGAPESAQEATKRRFREALEAKHGRDGADHIETDPHPTEHGHGPVNEKRTFRRKTG